LGEHRKIVIGSFLGLMKSIPIRDETIGEWSYFAEFYMGYSFQKIRLNATFTYYPEMLLMPGPISVERHLKVLEGSIVVGLNFLSCGKFHYLLKSGAIFAVGKYTSIHLGDTIYINCFSNMGILIGVTISKSLSRYLSLTLDLGTKHYILKGNETLRFKIEGINGGFGVKFYFPIQNRR